MWETTPEDGRGGKTHLGAISFVEMQWRKRTSEKKERLCKTFELGKGSSGET